MKILVITQYFYPENFRINQFCLDLKKRGYEVDVLTGKPNYPRGEYYKGYTFKGREDEDWNGIKVFRAPLRARKKGSINLLRNYLSFAYHSKKRVSKIKKNEYNVIYVFEVSPITVALPALKLKRKTNIPIVMNVQDLWPENIIAITGITFPPVIKMIDVLVKRIYKHCDLLLCASPSFVGKIKKKTKDKDKVLYWPQYSIVEQATDVDNYFNPNDFNIVFTGNVGKAQGLDLVIEAAKQLMDFPIKWHLIGDGSNKEELEKQVKENELGEIVKFYGHVGESEIPKYLASASAALLILKSDPVFEMTIPAKLQTYLACGVPIIGCVSGEAKKIVLDANAGIVSDRINTASLVEVCKKMVTLPDKELNKLKENALCYYKDNFNREVLLNKLDEYFIQICENIEK